MRTLIVIAIALTAALAGCVSGTLDPAASPDGTPSLDTLGSPEYPLVMGVTDCAAVIAVVPVSADGLAPHLPDGFTLWTPEQAGLPPDPRGDAVLGVEVLDCAGVYGYEGTIEDAAYGSYFTFVEPPAELKDPDATYHFVKWEHIVVDETYRAVLQDAGAQAVDGSGFVSAVSAVNVNGVAPTRALGGFVAGMTLGTDEVTFSGMAPDEWTDGLTGSFVEFTPAANGLVTWSPDYTWHSLASGAGVVTLDADSWTADVVGDTTAQAYYLFGTVEHFSGPAVLPAA